MTILYINFTSYVPTTLLGLLGLISGYLFFYFKNKNDNKLKEIKSTSRKDRVRVIEMSLNELGVPIDTANLDPAQKFDLIKGLLTTKTNRYLITSLTSIILSGFITFLIWSNNNKDNPKNRPDATDSKKTDSPSNLTQLSKLPTKTDSPSKPTHSNKLPTKTDSSSKPMQSNKLNTKTDASISSPKKDSKITYEMSFFEADETPTPESESADKFIFSQDSRYIYVRVNAKVDRPFTHIKSITFHVKFYDSFGKLKIDREPFTSFLSKGSSTDSFYSGFSQDWIPGKYPVVVYINEVQQPTKYFIIK